MINQDCTTQENLPPDNSRRTAARAFTLIEILIVVALTAVLFALLLVPLVSALRYTRQAQIVTAAQDAARITKERITRELGSAVFVFDGTSHPFVIPAGTTPAAGDDRYTNFLDLPILDKSANAVIAHAYDAKLDFVLPKLNDAGATVDPTTNEPIAYTQSQNGSAIISNPSLVFPLAAGTTMVRYFVGLKDPTLSYNNTHDGKTVSGVHSGDDNTYILYRAQFLPYVPKAGGGVQPNTNLFAIRKNSSNVDIPELDDPDFFRYVTQNDINWLNDSHNPYTAMEVTTHNARVDKWIQISKTIIPGPDVDLILLPHNADNTLAYDAASGAFPGVAHSGVAHDPVLNADHPIINTSVTFRPATVSGSATPGTTSNYSSAGVVSVDQAGFSYIPTVYTATSQSWSLPYHVGLYPGNYNAAVDMYYDTDQFASGDVAVTPTPSNVYLRGGDILEYQYSIVGGVGQTKLVYNVTQGYPVQYDSVSMKYSLGGTQFVPMAVNPDTGTLQFSAPSLPNGPADRYTRAWNYPALGSTAAPNTPGIAADGSVDLTLPASSPAALTDSPLQGAHTLSGTTPTLTGIANAHIVPGSLRVSGPDQTPGPNFGQPVTYTEINSSLNDPGDNQYVVDYAASSLRLRAGVASVSVIYDYQANMTYTTPLPSPLPNTFTMADLSSSTYLPLLPMGVTVDYQTRDLIDVSIGVRIYDANSNRAQVIPAETKVKIGNSNR